MVSTFQRSSLVFGQVLGAFMMDSVNSPNPANGLNSYTLASLLDIGT